MMHVGRAVAFIFCIFVSRFYSVDAQAKMITGLRYKSFSNPLGSLADGSCCDDPSLTAPNCPSDQCDVSFLPCATYAGGRDCAAYFHTPTPVMFDDDSFTLDNIIGNTKDTSSNLMVFIDSYSPDTINFNILALENSGTSSSLIANFSFVIDWMDTTFSEDDNWHVLDLTDGDAKLGLDVVRQCTKYYYGGTCSVYCKPTYQYTCLEDGSRNCTDGWEGSLCTDLVPYCASGLCQNGGSCTNIHLGYTCSCTSSYTGTNCELQATTTVTGPVAASSTLAPATSGNPTSTASRSSDLTTAVAASVSGGLFTLVVFLAAGACLWMKMKKRWYRRKVQSSPSPSQSRKASLLTDSF
ncbi:hypothetical protein EGW08_009375 [Elysia chlorotica]|uniref:Delta-like protein n=1 Tax=Elysia chlorotica TaxID=188477 RepID=A0A433TMQ0_ELYCH|nr:hypothetical protein EGW08_009375 [Elysia chlorotica]